MLPYNAPQQASPPSRDPLPQAMLQYHQETGEVRLVTDRRFCEGEPLTAWFGPQPNQRAFLNYGIVDENNPHDKMALQVWGPLRL